MSDSDQNPTHEHASIPPPPPGPPAAYGYPTPPQPKRRNLALPLGIAAAVTGAVLGGAVAAPVTWALAEQHADVTEPAEQDGQYALPEQPEGGDGSGGLTPDGLGPWSGDRPGQPGESSNRSFQEASADESTGVVLIDVETPGGQGAGTGWVVDESGVVVTNYHVVSDSTRVAVTDPATGETYDADVVGRNAEADVALLRLSDASGLTAVDMDDDGDPAVGDEVTAVGNPGGQGFLSASSGSVVALEQNITTRNARGGSAQPLEGLIETDTYVVGGFSGGVLLDDEDEVVGITTAASAGGPAESYAVPIEDALDVVEQIVDGDESGDVVIGPGAYLGITVADSSGPVTVADVEAEGPAAAAGLASGDVITAVDGQRVGSLTDLRDVLSGLEPGDDVPVAWTDGSGARQEGTVTLGESPVN
jgi:S1-C subfamily serine protease